MSWPERDLQCVFDLAFLFYECPPFPPKSMLAPRSFVFQFHVILDTCEINIEWRGKGDRNTRWKSKVKYWPVLGVAIFRWINLLTRPVTCRTLYGLKTTTHKHTRLHFMTSFRCKQHVVSSSSDVPAPWKTGSRIYTNPGQRLSIDRL